MDPQIQKAIEEGEREFLRSEENQLARSREFLRKDGWLVDKVREASAKGKREIRLSRNDLIINMCLDLGAMLKAIKEFGLNTNTYDSSIIIIYW